MNKTLAQKILGIPGLYASFDFPGRVKRRTVIVEQYIPRDMGICKSNLLAIKEVLDSMGVKFWLMYGTLLGAIRDKGFIDFDMDTDIGIYYEDKDRAYDIVIELQKRAFGLIRTYYEDTFVTVIRDDEYIDMMFFRKENLPFKNLVEHEFLDTKFLIPDNAEELFKDWYGEDWKMPIKDKHAKNIYGVDKLDYNREFWEDIYYEQFAVLETPSSFALFCSGFLTSGMKLLDIGCGNCRDSLFFNSVGINVTALDIAVTVPDKIKDTNIRFIKTDLTGKQESFGLKDSFDVVYCRFMLHCFHEDVEDFILKSAYDVLQDDGFLCIETRSDKGNLLSCSGDHYRRLINLEKLINKLMLLGLKIVYKVESDNLSLYLSDNPVLIRLICKK